jgi:pectate lyase
LSGGGTVTFSCSGTITLTSTITIASDTTIDGSGQAVTISGDN